MPAAPTQTYPGLSGPVASLNTAPRTSTGTAATPGALGGMPGGYMSVSPDPLIGGLMNMFSGNSFFGKGDKAKKPKAPLANKIYSKGKSTLQAYNALLGPTQDLL